jgi:hypothetical protein
MGHELTVCTMCHTCGYNELQLTEYTTACFR